MLCIERTAKCSIQYVKNSHCVMILMIDDVSRGSAFVIDINEPSTVDLRVSLFVGSFVFVLVLLFFYILVCFFVDIFHGWWGGVVVFFREGYLLRGFT